MDAALQWLSQLPENVKELPAYVWVAAASLVVLVVLLSRLRRRPMRTAPPEGEVRLVDLPPPPAEFADGSRLTCHGLPVRVRVVVAAPLGLDAGAVAVTDVAPLLDAAMPGLGDQAQLDAALVAAWPTQFSYEGFVASVRRCLVMPDPDEPLSPWILVAGRVMRGKRPFALGLALLAKQDNTLGPLRIDQPHQWMEVLRLSRSGKE